MKKQAEQIPENAAQLNAVTPMGIELKRNNVVIGENMGRIYGITKYLQEVENGWLCRS